MGTKLRDKRVRRPGERVKQNNVLWVHRRNGRRTRSGKKRQATRKAIYLREQEEENFETAT